MYSYMPNFIFSHFLSTQVNLLNICKKKKSHAKVTIIAFGYIPWIYIM